MGIPPLPLAVAHVSRPKDRDLRLITFCGIATPVRSLKIIPITRRFSWRIITKFFPPGDRADLVYHEGQRMQVVAWFIVMNGTEYPPAYSAGGSHCFEPCAMLASKVSVLVPRVSCHAPLSSAGSPPVFDRGACSLYPRPRPDKRWVHREEDYRSTRRTRAWRYCCAGKRQGPRVFSEAPSGRGVIAPACWWLG